MDTIQNRDLQEMNHQKFGSQDNKTLTYVLYALYIASIFSAGILSIIAIIINYIKLDSVKGTALESHFIWQIRSFWWYLFWNVVAIACVCLVVFVYHSPWWSATPLLGLSIVGIAWIWHVYRCIRGLITLSEDRPMYQ